LKGMLVRVGIDQTEDSGGWNSPVFGETGEFCYVPIREEQVSRLRQGLARYYDELDGPLRQFRAALPGDLREEPMHLDPDFGHLTYGDQWRKGRQVAELSPGDLIAFYAGMQETWNIGPRRLFYGLIGLYIVQDVVKAKDVPEPDWPNNAHTRREPKDDDIIVRAKEGESGRLPRAIRIGEYRDKAYRVTRDLLEEWGHLSVKDGFLTRNGTIPWFKNAERFYDWFKRQDYELVQSNW